MGPTQAPSPSGTAPEGEGVSVPLRIDAGAAVYPRPPLIRSVSYSRTIKAAVIIKFLGLPAAAHAGWIFFPATDNWL